MVISITTVKVRLLILDLRPAAHDFMVAMEGSSQTLLDTHLSINLMDRRDKHSTDHYVMWRLHVCQTDWDFMLPVAQGLQVDRLYVTCWINSVIMGKLSIHMARELAWEHLLLKCFTRLPKTRGSVVSEHRVTMRQTMWCKQKNPNLICVNDFMFISSGELRVTVILNVFRLYRNWAQVWTRDLEEVL